MKKIVHAFSLYAIIVCLFACNGNEVKETISKIRFINASSVAGDINVFIDYKKAFATDIQYLNYSLFSSHISTTHVIQIKTAGGSVIKEISLDMLNGKNYTAIVYDSSNFVNVKLLDEDFSTPKGSYCKLRFLHLSNNAPATDITQGSDTAVLFRNYSNGDYSEYNLYGIDSLAFNACNTGSSIPYHVQLRHVKFKAGYFYTMYLKGNMGSTGIDSLGFAVIENNGTY